MSRQRKGARLYLKSARKDAHGRITRQSVWIIRDGAVSRSTGAGPHEIERAEKALANYLATKATPRLRDRDPSAVDIATVIAIYADDAVHKHARPEETAARLDRVLAFFGGRALDTLNKQSCEDFVRWRGGAPVARRELEDLRAAVRHHWTLGLCTALSPVILPKRGEARERWLTRAEAARLIWAAWRLRETQDGRRTDRATAQHVARFILVALYTGTRAGAICGAAMRPMEGRGWIDLDNGVFYRRRAGVRRTKKRQPAIRIPPSLLAHMRRWKMRRIANDYLIEWQGKPVQRINKAFRSARRTAKLDEDVVPHTLRHTAVTWQAQLGVDPYVICGYFGITMEVFEAVYAHHHPDHQSAAVNALRRHQIGTRMAATKREQTSPNVRKIV